MKKQLKRWTIRIAALLLILVALLLIIVLNPAITYAGKTVYKSYTVYHNSAVDPALMTRLDEATALVQTSECYNPQLQLDICLHDGSVYPGIIKALHGRAFAFGFYNKVVLQGRADAANNYVELNGYRWNLTELLAHEMTHCYQFDKLGFWHSNPMATIPEWKWEGYAEYVSRKKVSETDLKKQISHLLQTSENSWAVYFADSSITPRTYYEYRLLLQYCMDIKKMNYRQVLADTSGMQAVKQEMMNWYKQ